MAEIGGETLRDAQPGHGRGPRDLPERDSGGDGRGRPLREGRVREMAEYARSSAWRAAPRGRANLSTEKGGSRADCHDGDGQGHRGRPRRRAGGHRLLRVRGRRGPPHVRRDGAVGTPEQDVPHGPAADRARGPHHALELPDGDPRLEERGRAHRGLLLRP